MSVSWATAKPESLGTSGAHDVELKDSDLDASVGPEIEQRSTFIIQDQIPLVLPEVQSRLAGSLALTGKDLVGTVAIGSQDFRIRFDTGSADVWVTSTLCTSEVCKDKHKYNPGTFPEPPETAELKYSDGSFVSGTIKTDTVNVAGVVATDQFLVAASTLSDQFLTKQYDGMIGMAMSRSRSGLNKDPFFITAIKQQKDLSQVFAFKLSDPASLYLGGTDKSLYTGEIEFHTLADSGPLWKLAVASVSVGSERVLSGLRTIIDTGSDIILGPPSEVREFYSKIPGNEMCEEAGIEFYFFPCPPGETVPSVSFSWGEKSWHMSEDTFVRLKHTEDGVQSCLGNIAGRNFGYGEKVWLLGDPFLKNVYTIFSLEDDTLGFAALK
ncbi:hypothetical protein Clacol_008761 [Clathrus columnatus]|uniref:Peptidase A1 domain-containing protein n=1 Tax=Clathrus columnatus TaxID=1419009 RepID=A0AAV5AL61_9AGAM|nr:hypothetical protein Clacol_008761 [Clathrus columnatus]